MKYIQQVYRTNSPKYSNNSSTILNILGNWIWVHWHIDWQYKTKSSFNSSRVLSFLLYSVHMQQMHAIVCDRWKISNQNILKLMDFCFIWFFSISSSFYLHTFSKPSYSSNAYTAGHHRQKTSFVFSAVCWTFSANVFRFIMCMNLEAHSMDLLLWGTNLWTKKPSTKILRFHLPISHIVWVYTRN